jgi:predicted DNA-binding transcriptional regulator AlpA
MSSPAVEYVHAVTVAKEFGVTRRTIGTWIHDPKMGFPRPTKINTRMYFERPAIEAWKSARAVASIRGTA